MTKDNNDSSKNEKTCAEIKKQHNNLNKIFNSHSWATLNQSMIPPINPLNSPMNSINFNINSFVKPQDLAKICEGITSIFDSGLKPQEFVKFNESIINTAKAIGDTILNSQEFVKFHESLNSFMNYTLIPALKSQEFVKFNESIISATNSLVKSEGFTSMIENIRKAQKYSIINTSFGHDKFAIPSNSYTEAAAIHPDLHDIPNELKPLAYSMLEILYYGILQKTKNNKKIVYAMSFIFCALLVGFLNAAGADMYERYKEFFFNKNKIIEKAKDDNNQLGEVKVAKNNVVRLKANKKSLIMHKCHLAERVILLPQRTKKMRYITYEHNGELYQGWISHTSVRAVKAQSRTNLNKNCHEFDF